MYVYPSRSYQLPEVVVFPFMEFTVLNFSALLAYFNQAIAGIQVVELTQALLRQGKSIDQIMEVLMPVLKSMLQLGDY